MFWIRIHRKHTLILVTQSHVKYHIDGLVQDCSNSIANALELLQSCTKPSIWYIRCRSNILIHISYRSNWPIRSPSYYLNQRWSSSLTSGVRGGGGGSQTYFRLKLCKLQSFSLKFAPKMWFLVLYIFARLFWESSSVNNQLNNLIKASVIKYISPKLRTKSRFQNTGISVLKTEQKTYLIIFTTSLNSTLDLNEILIRAQYFYNFIIKLCVK